MWVLKFHGETYYVNHVECNVPWSTKETPDSSHTKGSIKVKNCLLQINDNNEAQISTITAVDRARIRNTKKGITRVVISYRYIAQLKSALKDHEIKHGPFKSIGGACTTTFYITDIFNLEDMTILSLKLAGITDFRVLKPNEGYYRYYDDPRYTETEDIDLDFDNDDDSD
jgi:hypothetical protein